MLTCSKSRQNKKCARYEGFWGGGLFRTNFWLLNSIDDFRALIIERVVPNDGAWLLEREEMWIKRLDTKRPHGLNRND